jgi:hypothetical protein
MKKILVVGVILLFFGLTTLPSSSMPVIKAQPSKTDSVSFIFYPANGLYWNNHTIANYSVPLFLRLKGGNISHLKLKVIGDNIDRVEFWIGHYFQFTAGPPDPCWILNGPFHIRPFNHYGPYTIKVYMDSGLLIWYNYTVYRWF